ncbi:MAG TPA: GAF domain-containing protein [bacterium]|nr:GAF domain-containing protein [bacterium]
MKKMFVMFLKVVVIVFTVAAFYSVLKLDKSWWLAVLFAFNFPIAASYFVFGAGASAVFLAAAMAAGIIVIMKSLAAHTGLLPVLFEMAGFVIVFIMIKKAADINHYFIFSVKDEMMSMEGGYTANLVEKENLINAVKSNRAKLEKYRMLGEVYEGLDSHNTFSSKIRYVLRNVISIFHQERTISLLIARDGRFIKVEADKDDDILSGEKDQEGLDLRGFDEWVMKNRKSILISDMHKEVRFKGEEGEKNRSVICVPVVVAGETAGVLRVSSEKPGVFDREDLRFLDLIAEITAKVISGETANAQ